MAPKICPCVITTKGSCNKMIKNLSSICFIQNVMFQPLFFLNLKLLSFILSLNIVKLFKIIK